MSPAPLPDVRTLLAEISTWHSRLPVQHATPLKGRTAECDAVLYGVTGHSDETLFLYGYCVGKDEYCFLYDTPWDETHRALNGGHPAEWYDGLEMPRSFRVRYSVSDPTQHEILDPLLKEMMKRPLRPLGTRPAIPDVLTAGAEQVLRDIDAWDERLRFLRRGRLLVPARETQVAGWTSASARFGGLVGSGNSTHAHYRYTVGETLYVFVVRTLPPISRMTPSDYAPMSSRKERRAHLAQARRQEQGFHSLTSGQEFSVRFNPRDSGEHLIELSRDQDGAGPVVFDPSTVAYQLEPLR